MLANFEQQMQFDPTGNYSSNLTFENRHEKSRELLREQRKLDDAKIPKKVNHSIECEEKYEEDENEVGKNCESPIDDVVTGIVLNIDPHVSQ